MLRFRSVARVCSKHCNRVNKVVIHNNEVVASINEIIMTAKRNYGDSLGKTIFYQGKRITIGKDTLTVYTDITNMIIQNIDRPDIVKELLRSYGYVRPNNGIIGMVIQAKNFELLDFILDTDKEDLFAEPLNYIGLCDKADKDCLLKLRKKYLWKYPLSPESINISDLETISCDDAMNYKPSPRSTGRVTDPLMLYILANQFKQPDPPDGQDRSTFVDQQCLYSENFENSSTNEHSFWSWSSSNNDCDDISDD